MSAYPLAVFSAQTLISSCAQQEYGETTIHMLFTMPHRPPRAQALGLRARFPWQTSCKHQNAKRLTQTRRARSSALRAW
jgi:hypothetical protein